MKPFLEQLYSSMKVNNNIHNQTHPNQLQRFGINNIYLNYEGINNNKQQYGRDYRKYDYNVLNEVDLSKIFLHDTHITKYTKFVEACDASALLGILTNIDCFPQAVKSRAEVVGTSI